MMKSRLGVVWQENNFPMPTPFQPLPDDEPLLDKAQFLFRLKHDPGFAEKMQMHYEAALALPLNEETAELQKSAAAGLRMLKHHQGAWHAMKCLSQAATLGDEGNHEASEVLARFKTLVAEATDHLLDVCEPERTKLMGQVARLRERIAEIEKKWGL